MEKYKHTLLEHIQIQFYHMVGPLLALVTAMSLNRVAGSFYVRVIEVLACQQYLVLGSLNQLVFLFLILSLLNNLCCFSNSSIVLSILISQKTNAVCHGGRGAIRATASGGTLPYFMIGAIIPYLILLKSFHMLELINWFLMTIIYAMLHQLSLGLISLSLVWHHHSIIQL